LPNKKGLESLPNPLKNMVGDTGVEVSDLLHVKQISPHFSGFVIPLNSRLKVHGCCICTIMVNDTIQHNYAPIITNAATNRHTHSSVASVSFVSKH